MLMQIKLFLISLMMASSGTNTISQVDVDELSCLAHGVFYEASAEPLDGKIGIANVVVNRVKNPLFPSSTICGVLKEKGQFSYWKHAKKINLSNEKVRAQVEESISAAQSVMTGEVGDNTNGALYFANTKQSTDKNWIRRMLSKLKRTVKIANHTFFAPKGQHVEPS